MAQGTPLVNRTTLLLRPRLARVRNASGREECLRRQRDSPRERKAALALCLAYVIVRVRLALRGVYIDRRARTEPEGVGMYP